MGRGEAGGKVKRRKRFRMIALGTERERNRGRQTVVQPTGVPSEVFWRDSLAINDLENKVLGRRPRENIFIVDQRGQAWTERGRDGDIELESTFWEKPDADGKKFILNKAEQTRTNLSRQPTEEALSRLTRS